MAEQDSDRGVPSGSTRRFSGPGRDLSAPQRLGHYHLRRVIGTGGMGTVYEAVQEHPRRTVALKLMNPGVTSPAALRRFEYESQILARLNHPAIAAVFEAGTHETPAGTVPYFAMEYVPNARSLTEYSRDRRLTARQRLELFVSVCDAVHHGHRKGIIHRDLKPGNILVDPSGALKIIDFGVARATDSDLALTTLQTDAGQLLGTLQYMSPEQVEADPQAIDTRSDVYALGVVLYELLSERLPYDVSEAGVVQAPQVIREQPPKRLSTRDARLRGDLETIVHTALQKDPALRYQSAEDLRRDVSRYLDGEPIVARRPSLAYVMRTRSRAAIQRHPVGAMAACVLASVVLVDSIGIAVLHQWRPARALFKQLYAAVPWPADSGSLSKVCVVRITDATTAAAGILAREAGLAGVNPDNWKSMRRLHGAFMERLAAAGVRLVTWNVAFPGATPFDEDFARGADAVRDAGGDVVVAVIDWPLDSAPKISPGIAEHVRWGGSTVNFTGSAPWNLHFFARRGADRVCPSLVLASIGAFLRPGLQTRYAVDWHNEGVVLGYRAPDAGLLRETDAISLTSIEQYQGEPAEGRSPGDVIGICVFDVPDDETLAASAVDYEWIFVAPQEELRRRLGGQAVVVGDFRSAGPGAIPPYASPDGRSLAGTWGHAAALDMLLAGRAVRFGRPLVDPAIWLVASLLGVLLAVVATGRPLLRVALLVATGAAGIVVCVFAYHELHYLVNPLLALLALVVACELAVRINRTRLKRIA